MLFQSWTFAIFLLIVFPIYLLVKNTRLRSVWLVIASYAFYAFWAPVYVVLLFLVTAVAYVSVILMDKTGHRKIWLAAGILCQICLLGFFKYGAFVANNLNALFRDLSLNIELGWPADFLPPCLRYALPVGISFYTFCAITYSIDFYRGQLRRETNFLRFAAFVAFFPRLLMGPIERAKNALPQLSKPIRITSQDIADGLSLFITGLFKKVAVADYLAMYVSSVYDNPADCKAGALLAATFAFAWQIYFDFSGYTDMARGVARLFGFNLMLNFNNPYLATGLTDFWRRWHISLSSWFRDYVYIPLGGNRKGEFRIYVNVFITMVVSGLWHGAAWNFVIWGALHGLGACLTRRLEKSQVYVEKVPLFVKRACVFVFVTFAWIFFRAESLSDAWLIITRIFTAGLGDPRFPALALAMIVVLWAYAFVYESRLQWALRLAPVRTALVILMLLWLTIFAPSGRQGFIYLQF